MEFLNIQDESAVHAGLRGLLAIIGRYEFEDRDDQGGQLNEIVAQSFPALGKLVHQMIQMQQQGEDGDDAGCLLHLVCKVVYKSNHVCVCPYLMEGENMDPWISFFKRILDMVVPAHLASETEDQDEITKRNKTKIWKIKGVIATLTFRMLGGLDPSDCDEDIQPFATKFQQRYAIPLLESHLQLLFLRKQNFIGSKCMQYVIRFIEQSSQQHHTMTMLKPYIDRIIFDTIIPLMFITKVDMHMFHAEPVEYIRNLYDFRHVRF